MPKLKNIVSYINSSLWKDGVLKNRSGFQGGQYYGLAKQVIKINPNNQNELVPFIYSGRDEIELTNDPESPKLNDTYPFQIYHRVNSIVVRTFNSDQKLYEGGIVETATMLAIVFADPEKVNIEQEDLAFLLFAGLQSDVADSVINDLSLQSVKINPVSANVNSQSVWQNEYQSADYRLSPQSIYFSISYTIETTSHKNCLSCQDC